MTDDPQNISDAPQTNLDWENRRLCIDDSCIGIIGDDGRCRVCGLPDTTAPVGSDRPGSSITVQEESLKPDAEDQAPDADDPGWEDRKLCNDESCIGTIGADGRCSVCGLTG